MSNARPPTVQETVELARHYAKIMFAHDPNDDAEQRLEEMFCFLENLWIAVFDDYAIRGFGGKMAVTISIEGIVELLVWESGRIKSITCSG
jgi:hypothetical protein